MHGQANTKAESLHQRIGLKAEEETNEVLHSDHCPPFGLKIGHFGE